MKGGGLKREELMAEPEKEKIGEGGSGVCLS